MFLTFDHIFHVYLMRRFQKYGKNWILTVAFWGQTKAGQKFAARWAELAGNPESHRENSISFIFLEPLHQVDMKNVVKSSLFGVFQYSRNSHCILSKNTIYFLFSNEITLWILVSSILVSLQHLLPLFKLKGKQKFSKTVILWYVGQLG